MPPPADSDLPEWTAARDEWAGLHLRHALRDRYASYEGPRRIWSSPAPRLWWAGSTVWLNPAGLVRSTTGSDCHRPVMLYIQRKYFK